MYCIFRNGCKDFCRFHKANYSFCELYVVFSCPFHCAIMYSINIHIKFYSYAKSVRIPVSRDESTRLRTDTSLKENRIQLAHI